MRVRVTDYRNRQEPMPAIIFGRWPGRRAGKPYPAGRSVWHIFRMKGRSIGFTLCGKPFSLDVELSQEKPRGRICQACQRGLPGDRTFESKGSS